MTAKTFDELWPIPYPNIVIVTGEYGCGKSTFGLSTGAEPKRNCYIDFEKSGEGYAKQMGVGAYWSAISLTNDRAPAEQIWVHEGWNS